MTRTTLVDLGVGNLGNLERALRYLGADVTRTSDPGALATASCVVLPGVGAFRPPRERLRGPLEVALRTAVGNGAWLLGICVGHQLLFEASEEHGTTDGLGLLAGRVEELSPRAGLPHIGWNRLRALGGHPLLAGIEDGTPVYFVHSYAARGVPASDTLAVCTHGESFVAAAGRERVLGLQFHPEKSGDPGLRVLRNYLELADGAVSRHRSA